MTTTSAEPALTPGKDKGGEMKDKGGRMKDEEKRLTGFHPFAFSLHPYCEDGVGATEVPTPSVSDQLFTRLRRQVYRIGPTGSSEQVGLMSYGYAR